MDGPWDTDCPVVIACDIEVDNVGIAWAGATQWPCTSQVGCDIAT